MRRLRKAPRAFGGGTRIYTRARKIRPGPIPGLAPVQPVGGLNQWESRVYYALMELRIQFSTQTNFMGGSILGGARADFVLPDYKIVLNVDGPFHFTANGQARDLLVNATYRASGFTVRSVTQADMPDLKNTLRRLLGVPLRA